MASSYFTARHFTLLSLLIVVFVLGHFYTNTWSQVVSNSNCQVEGSPIALASVSDSALTADPVVVRKYHRKYPQYVYRFVAVLFVADYLSLLLSALFPPRPIPAAPTNWIIILTQPRRFFPILAYPLIIIIIIIIIIAECRVWSNDCLLSDFLLPIEVRVNSIERARVRQITLPPRHPTTLCPCSPCTPT